MTNVNIKTKRRRRKRRGRRGRRRRRRRERRRGKRRGRAGEERRSSKPPSTPGARCCLSWFWGMKRGLGRSQRSAWLLSFHQASGFSPNPEEEEVSRPRKSERKFRGSSSQGEEKQLQQIRFGGRDNDDGGEVDERSYSLGACWVLSSELSVYRKQEECDEELFDF